MEREEDTEGGREGWQRERQEPTDWLEVGREGRKEGGGEGKKEKR